MTVENFKKHLENLKERGELQDVPKMVENLKNSGDSDRLKVVEEVFGTKENNKKSK